MIAVRWNASTDMRQWSAILPESSDEVAFEPERLFHRLEHPLDRLPETVDRLPSLAPAMDRTQHTMGVGPERII